MANSREEIKRDLDDILVKGLAENICQAEEAMALCAGIGENAGAGFGSGNRQLFSRIRIMLERYAILAVTRLFEPEEDGFHSISIPVALNYMRFHADYLELNDREFILKKLISFGHEAKEFEGIPDPWITQLVRKEFADRMPNDDDPDSDDLSKALVSLKSMRDTFVTDAVTEQELEEIEKAERSMKTLLIYARDFIGTIGQGYLGVVFESNPNVLQNELAQLLNRIGAPQD
ncbi:MAG: hypothetical protein HOC20_09620 [Chloroflexi bacterium]|jgi:hypothetical protein|nr:hypothetical protein [Chloroflexota bacterium]